MRWRIIGASRYNLDDTEIVVEAGTKTAAEGQARQCGVLVEKIERASDNTPTTSPLSSSLRPAIDVHVKQDRPILTERTSKRFKKGMLVCGLLAIGGCTMIMASAADGPQMILGGLLFWGGVLGFIVYRLSAWWHHG